MVQRGSSSTVLQSDGLAKLKTVAVTGTEGVSGGVGRGALIESKMLKIGMVLQVAH